MTFFDWLGDPPTISPDIWIYFAFTFVFTALTLYLWYFFGVSKPARDQKASMGINSIALGAVGANEGEEGATGRGAHYSRYFSMARGAMLIRDRLRRGREGTPGPC